MPFKKYDYFRSCYLLLLALYLVTPSILPGQDLDVYIKWSGPAQNYPFHAVKLNSGFEYCEVGELLGNFPPGGPITTGGDATICPDGNIYFYTISNQFHLIQLNPVTKQASIFYNEFPLPGGFGNAHFLACNCDSVIYSMGTHSFQYPINKTLLGADSSVHIGNVSSLQPTNAYGDLTYLNGDYYFPIWYVSNPTYSGFIMKIDTNDIANPQPVVDYLDIFTGTPRHFYGLTSSPYCNTLIGVARTTPPITPIQGRQKPVLST